MNRITFTLTVDDLVAAQRLYQSAGLKRYLAIAGFAVLTGVVIITRWPQTEPGSGWWFLILLTAFVVTVPAISRLWGIPRMARRAMEQDPAMRAPCTFIWDETTASVESEAGSWNQPLASFVCWRADERVILLFRQTHLYHPLPRHAFRDAAQRQTLIDALVKNGVSNHWPPR